MKLYRFRYSPYARKVQMVLELLGRDHTVIDVPYGQREELARLTGGHVYVPVLEDDDGAVVCDSRAICEHLLKGAAAARLAPPPLQGAIWAYADHVDGPIEDVLFRLASPAVREAWPSKWERALYVLVKERKFGAGCVDAWERERDALIARGRKLLEPTLATLAASPFLFGERPTLADAALYGQCAMLDEADPTLLTRVAEPLVGFARRMEAARAAR
jgi:glutathione S-transferase